MICITFGRYDPVTNFREPVLVKFEEHHWIALLAKVTFENSTAYIQASCFYSEFHFKFFLHNFWVEFLQKAVAIKIAPNLKCYFASSAKLLNQK